MAGSLLEMWVHVRLQTRTSWGGTTEFIFPSQVLPNETRGTKFKNSNINKIKMLVY
jgi:hypothetical protein